MTEQTVQAPTPTRARLLWVDVAKAFAITLVVVHHVVTFAKAPGWLPDAVVTLNDQAATVRMPLFFLASGLFAAGALSRPWGVVARKRVLFFAYLFLLWTVLRFALFQVVPDVRPHGLDGDLPALLRSPLLPGTGLWFIYALAVFSVLAKATLRVSVAVQLAVAAAASAVVGSERLWIDNLAWRNMATYYVFFLVGTHLRRHVEAFAARVTAAATAGLAVAVAAGSAVVLRADLETVPGVRLALSCVAVAFGVALAVQVARVPGLNGVVAGLGERTLPVYLLHVPFVAAAVALLEAVLAPRGTAGLLLVPVLTVLAGAASLALHGPARRRLPWLFALPGRRRVVLL